MGANTTIEWAHHTFNPFFGCTKVGPGCDNCYAEQLMDKRLHKVKWGVGEQRVRTSESNWQQPLKWDREAARLGIRYRVFCASLADVFDNAVDPQWRADLFSLIEATPHLDWLLLTKRIGNVMKMLPSNTSNEEAADFARLWPNVWIGATIVNQEEADRDIPKLLAIPAAKRFLSMEPLLGPVDISRYMWPVHPRWPEKYDSPAEAIADGAEVTYHRQALISKDWADHLVNWVIVGGESGPNARPMHPDWARSLRDQCVAAGVPILFKQWGEWIPAEFPSSEECFAEDGSERTLEGRIKRLRVDGHVDMARIGKKAAGRLLDGRTWDEVPS